MSLTLFVGGVRCGKSALAEKWAENASASRLLLAPGRARDEETAARIAAHKARRDASWLTLETPETPLENLREFLTATPAFSGSILFDSLDSWLANMLFGGLKEKKILEKAAALFSFFRKTRRVCVMVSAECGLGFVPLNPLARSFGDTLGLANQLAALESERVFFVACGLATPIKTPRN